MATPTPLRPGDPAYPPSLLARLGPDAPATLVALGHLATLSHRLTALFCSAQTPGDAILRAFDTAGRLRDEGVTVIGGFHSPIEKECLRILLRGKQPIIVCPARALDGMRIPGDRRAAWEAGRVLFLSPFAATPTRVTRESALRRNEVVAALADEVYFAHIAPGGEAERLARTARRWGIPLVLPAGEAT